MATKKHIRVGAMDFETDPFKRGAEIAPFCWGISWDDGEYNEGWGENSVSDLADTLRGVGEDCIVYAHNGGRFDFIFLVKHLDSDALIIDGRIVKATIGSVELRDSYLILPHKLADIGMKIGIDYKRFHKSKREGYKTQIQKYMKQDCDTLLAEVLKFRERFGNALTVASAATIQLNKIHRRNGGESIGRLTLDADKFFRQFYFGGRNEAFEKGVLRDTWEVRDVRSMFPAVMRDYKHPTGTDYVACREITEHTDFAIVEATSQGCLPVRLDGGGVSYPKARQVFSATGHELRAATELGLVKIHRVISAFEFSRRENFSEFVHEFGELRMQAIRNGDHGAAQHYKDILNRSYGKQALNIHDMGSWKIEPEIDLVTPELFEELKAEGFDVAYSGAGVSFWKRPLTFVEKARMCRNVACGASITGAARAELMRALAVAERPVYTDTDCIICRNLPIPEADKIGGWRVVDRGNVLAIAGKKKYALFDEIGPRSFACAGGDLTPEQIVGLCGGESITWYSETPTYSAASNGHYIKREFRMT